MKYFDSFAGVGGFSLGLPKSFKCIGMSEVDKYCNMVLQYKFPNIKNYGDITEINFNDIPDFDLLIGGSPCQGFSLAGNKQGFLDIRSRLFNSYISLLKTKKPRYFIWENVEGCLSSNGGRDFAYIINAFSEMGYSIRWQLLNAKHFDTPQNRPRVFITGCLDSKDAIERFSLPVVGKKNDLKATFGIRPMEATVSKCVVAGYSKNPSDSTYIYNLENDRVRRLLPIECERLQGWPDDWTKYGLCDDDNLIEISDKQRYKMIGNGVCPNVVKSIIKAMQL
jgi:DNA (cytosine-5)-methyltransferase 1